MRWADQLSNGLIVNVHSPLNAHDVQCTMPSLLERGERKKAKVMKARDDWGLDLQTQILLFIYFNSTGVLPVELWMYY